MIDETKIRHSAQLMVDRLGEHALMLAYERAAELELLGDSEGKAAWLQIAEAIKSLARNRQGVGAGSRV